MLIARAVLNSGSCPFERVVRRGCGRSIEIGTLLERLTDGVELTDADCLALSDTGAEFTDNEGAAMVLFI